MNLTNLFDKIAGKQKQREQANASDFRGLVTAIATGNEPDRSSGRGEGRGLGTRTGRGEQAAGKPGEAGSRLSGTDARTVIPGRDSGP